jgi:hypothetical protein
MANPAIGTRLCRNGWHVDFHDMISTSDPDGIVQWCEANATGPYSVILESIAFAKEDDALLCYVMFA